MIRHDTFEGPINLVAPNPIPNAEMMRTLRQVCGVPFGLPATNWMLEVGAFVMQTETELLIKSRRVIPGRLLKSGLDFEFPTVREAFQNLNQWVRKGFKGENGGKIALQSSREG